MAIQFDNTNTGVATLKPATSGTLTLTLPSADGTSGQALTTHGSGQLAFSTGGGGGGGGDSSPIPKLQSWSIGGF
jgi:hypothetical protein